MLWCLVMLDVESNYTSASEAWNVLSSNKVCSDLQFMKLFN